MVGYLSLYERFRFCLSKLARIIIITTKYMITVQVSANKYSHHTLQFSADLCDTYNSTMLPAGVSSVFKNFGLYML
jgi:hypothetical protein